MGKDMENIHLENQSNLIRKTSCLSCSSSDARAIYDDGHSYCFSCQTYFQDEEKELPTMTKKVPVDLIKDGQITALKNRKIYQETCERYHYQTGMDSKGIGCHIANYFDKDGIRVAQKIRYADKRFTCLGNAKDMPLFGMHTVNNTRDKIAITEGEIDCLSLSQCLGGKHNVVSLPNGISNVGKVMKNHYEFLDQFDEIVLFFDNDEHGQSAIADAVQFLPSNKVRIATLSRKDASDCLTNGDSQELVDAFYKARPWRPSGITDFSSLLPNLLEKSQSGIKTPFSTLDKMIGGLRPSSLTVISAGSGVGKSTFCREIAYDLGFGSNTKVGLMMLEESVTTTARSLISIHLEKNVVINSDIPEDLIRQAHTALAHTNNFVLFDSFGSMEINDLLSRIRFMVTGLECQVVVLDHITIASSGMLDRIGDERKMIDATMTKLRSIVQELDFHLIVVTHLRRPQGEKGYEDGLRVSLQSLRGSHSLVQLADNVVSLNVVGHDKNFRNLEVLKNRWSGITGFAGYLKYDKDSGRLWETDEEPEGENVWTKDTKEEGMSSTSKPMDF